MDMESPAVMLISGLIALLAAVAIPSLVKFSTAFKRSQQWRQENAQDRAGCRENDWYPQSDSEKSRKLASRRH